MASSGDNSTLIWLRPGLHVKRWLILLMIGIALLSLGLAYLFVQLNASTAYPPYLYYLTLQFLSPPLRALLLGGVGIGLTAWALVQLSRSLILPFVPPGQENVAKTMYRHHQRRRGPKIVALGGGTGLSTLLRGLKEYSDNITAIVVQMDAT